MFHSTLSASLLLHKHQLEAASPLLLLLLLLPCRQSSAINKCKARLSRHSPVPVYTQLANCLFGMPASR
jgi:hypothetical protein